MIHAFVAGFAGAIGVLVAFSMWNRIAAWRERRRIVVAERKYWAAIREQERRAVEEQQRLERERECLIHKEQRRLVGTQRGDWPTDIFGWMQVSLSVLFYVCLVGGLIAALTV